MKRNTEPDPERQRRNRCWRGMEKELDAMFKKVDPKQLEDLGLGPGQVEAFIAEKPGNLDDDGKVAIKCILQTQRFTAFSAIADADFRPHALRIEQYWKALNDSTVRLPDEAA